MLGVVLPKSTVKVVLPGLQILADAGVNDYSIFLDEETNILFAVLRIENPAKMDMLPQHPAVKKWWAYMKDLMETNPDNSPVSAPLTDVFYLP